MDTELFVRGVRCLGNHLGPYAIDDDGVGCENGVPIVYVTTEMRQRLRGALAEACDERGWYCKIHNGWIVVKGIDAYASLVTADGVSYTTAIAAMICAIEAGHG